MHKANPFRFPRLRLWLFRLANTLKKTEQPTEAEIQARINIARAEERQRLSQPLQNAPTAPSEGTSVWTAQLPPTVAYLSPEPPQRARVLSPRERAAVKGFHATQQRYQTGIVQSVHLLRLTHETGTGRLPTLHTLPTVSRPLQGHIDAQSRETPPEGYDFSIEPVDEDATEKMSALHRLAWKRA